MSLEMLVQTHKLKCNSVFAMYLKIITITDTPGFEASCHLGQVFTKSEGGYHNEQWLHGLVYNFKTEMNPQRAMYCIELPCRHTWSMCNHQSIAAVHCVLVAEQTWTVTDSSTHMHSSEQEHLLRNHSYKLAWDILGRKAGHDWHEKGG